MAAMIDHVSNTVADIDRAQRFSDPVMEGLGYPRVYRRERAIGYGVCNRPGDDGHSYMAVILGDAVVPDPRHWAFRAPDREAVVAFHAAGLAAGGLDDGPPGPRPEYHPTYFGAFLLDPDGNRIEAVCHTPELPSA